MAKKKSKQLSNQLNAAKFGDTATASTNSQPADTSQVNVHAPAATRLTFFNFITIATMKDIRNFLKLAAATPEGQNLISLWDRAYDDGYRNGRKSLLRSLENGGEIQGRSRDGNGFGS